jgi:hypothetical protein
MCEQGSATRLSQVDSDPLGPRSSQHHHPNTTQPHSRPRVRGSDRVEWCVGLDWAGPGQAGLVLLSQGARARRTNFD